MPSTLELRHVPTALSCSPIPLPWRTSGVASLVGHARPADNVHDRASRATLLTRIAAVLDQPLLDPMDVEQASLATALLVPGEALEARVAAAAGITDRHGLLGGVVPAPFVATKAISHGLVDDRAACPAGWSFAMSRLLGDAALPGYTAFTHTDAATAGRLLLVRGPVRIKDVCGKAGLGQRVVRSTEQLDAALALEDAADLAEHGIVLEENLTDVVTYSVGTVELGHQCVSYWGTQTLTTDHKGREVYGGTDLHVVRGGFAELAALDLPGRLSQAIRCAAIFDAAAHAAYPDILLTRRNYDVIEGTDAAGNRRIGVLEQSWRVGGASGAELSAFEAFRAEPGTTQVRCSTVEVYDLVTPPVGAVTYYQGVDPVVGAMTKYAMRYA
ncbi:MULTISPECIES: DUF3182 family protein [Bacteria]|uniref:DUF3182 family protein n=1 Tax=Bacteria TaxID=2 RepID=UPI000D50EE74|nr:MULTISPECIES: DUF3182 family protein [Bacteria]PVE52656.1 DUF3182 domain-containing protein [Sphingomonas sp. TPD3009]PVE81228.1 DUF3182 domain-containing protein [Sphingomonas melonis]